MMSSQIAGGEPFDASRTAQIPEHFRRDGFCRIPGVLAADEVATLREQTGRLMAAPGVVPAATSSVASATSGASRMQSRAVVG